MFFIGIVHSPLGMRPASPWGTNDADEMLPAYLRAAPGAPPLFVGGTVLRTPAAARTGAEVNSPWRGPHGKT